MRIRKCPFHGANQRRCQDHIAQERSLNDENILHVEVLLTRQVFTGECVRMRNRAGYPYFSSFTASSISMMGMSSLMGYMSLHESQMRPLPSSFSLMSPLHFGQASISNNSLLNAIFPPFNPRSPCYAPKRGIHPPFIKGGRPMSVCVENPNIFAEFRQDALTFSRGIDTFFR